MCFILHTQLNKLIPLCKKPSILYLPFKHLGCSSTQFRCTSGQCVSTSSRCTGINTCSDRSDEMNCSKLLLLVLVFPTRNVINLFSLTFEPTITVTCSSGAFRCSNRQCIRSSDRCDGNRDCTDGSDERNCSKFLVLI